MNQIGIIGLSTMGGNLALNLASKGYHTAVYNRSYEKTEHLLNIHQQNLTGYKQLKDFVESLERPRKIILLVKAGPAVDQTINDLKEYLQDDDIIIDMGNSNWRDTQRRLAELESSGVKFVGCGISGGSKGALLGPSIMPGGDKTAVQSILQILQDISAADFEGRPCVTYIGREFAGHFVKMVHNGIEYAIMQGIAEMYSNLLSHGLVQDKITEIFRELNHKGSPVSGFLLDVTIEALEKRDETGRYILPRVDSRAGSKGTGRWTVEAALELGVAVPTIAEAVFARVLSQGDFFLQFEQRNSNPDSKQVSKDLRLSVKSISNSLQSIYLASFLQGLDLIARANQEYELDINLHEVLRIWQGGCIIRTEYLKKLEQILIAGQIQEIDLYDSNIEKCLHNLLESSPDLSLPVTLSAVSYLKGLQQVSFGNYPTNLVQLQRNIFGEHEIKLK